MKSDVQELSPPRTGLTCEIPRIPVYFAEDGPPNFDVVPQNRLNILYQTARNIARLVAREAPVLVEHKFLSNQFFQSSTFELSLKFSRRANNSICRRFVLYRDRVR
jgi:hypothetical protein